MTNLGEKGETEEEKGTRGGRRTDESSLLFGARGVHEKSRYSKKWRKGGKHFVARGMTKEGGGRKNRNCLATRCWGFEKGGGEAREGWGSNEPGVVLSRSSGF